MKVVLLSTDGGLVRRCEIPDFNPPPGGVAWGPRFFRLDGALKLPQRLDTSPSLGELAYTESILFTIPIVTEPSSISQVALTLAKPVLYKKAVVVCGSYTEYKEYLRCRAEDVEVVKRFGQSLTQRNSMFLGNINQLYGYDRKSTYIIYCGNYPRNAEARDPYIRQFDSVWYDERRIVLEPSLKLNVDPGGEPYVGHPSSMPILDEDL